MRVSNSLVRFYKLVILVFLETKINRNKVNEKVKKFGFSTHLRIETEGLSDGIWLFGQADVV